MTTAHTSVPGASVIRGRAGAGAVVSADPFTGAPHDSQKRAAAPIAVPQFVQVEGSGAIERARELKLNAIRCEIWQDDRLVATLKADDLSASG